MAPIGTLYMYDPFHPGAHRARRILATAAWTDAEITLAQDYTHGVTNKTPEFQKKFPIQMVPTFETAEGEFISEGSAIAWYIAKSTNSSLLPTSVAQQAQVAQWQSFVDIEILPDLIGVYAIEKGVFPGGKEVQKFRLNRILNNVRKLDDLFRDKEAEGKGLFLVGDGVTLADIAVVSGLTRGYTEVFDSEIQERYPNTLKYYLSIIKHPKFTKIWGDVVLQTKTTVAKE